MIFLLIIDCDRGKYSEYSAEKNPQLTENELKHDVFEFFK